ncbi:MAG: imelysin family protein [Algibacter sp.]
MSYLNKKHILFLGSIFAFSLFFTGISCDEGDISKDEYQIQYLRKEQLSNLYNNEILPLNTEFISSTEALINSIEAFKQDVTTENLENARLQWVNMLKIWKHLELYNLGGVQDSFIHFEINRWPTNTEIIEGYIEGTETIDEAFIASNGSSSKGISALEYILFSSQNIEEVINAFSVNTNFERRLDYLDALAHNLKTKAQNLQVIWTTDEAEFINALENGISGSQSQLTNALITLIEEVVISKLGNALGDNTGGTIDVEALEAYRSGSSLVIIQAHLTALNRCYEGAFIEKTIAWGYDDYLKLISNETLDAEIVDAFNLCQTKIDAISGTLYDELTNSPENVIDLQEAFTNLLVFIKVDLANAIGTTVTINDNDGD